MLQQVEQRLEDARELDEVQFKEGTQLVLPHLRDQRIVRWADLGRLVSFAFHIHTHSAGDATVHVLHASHGTADASFTLKLGLLRHGRLRLLLGLPLEQGLRSVEQLCQLLEFENSRECLFLRFSNLIITVGSLAVLLLLEEFVEQLGRLLLVLLLEEVVIVAVVLASLVVPLDVGLEGHNLVLFPGILVELNCLKSETDLVLSEGAVLAQRVKADNELLGVLKEGRLLRRLLHRPRIVTVFFRSAGFLHLLAPRVLRLLPLFTLCLDFSDDSHVLLFLGHGVVHRLLGQAALVLELDGEVGTQPRHLEEL